MSAQATLRPLRTAAEQVPADAAAVTVTYRRSGGAAYIDSWGSPQAQVLAGALNALDTQLSDVIVVDDPACTGNDPVYTVTFEVSHQPLEFRDYGCGVIDVTAGGVAQPGLETGDVESRLYSMSACSCRPSRARLRRLSIGTGRFIARSVAPSRPVRLAGSSRGPVLQAEGGSPP